MAKATCVYSTPPTNTSAIDHPIMFPPRMTSFNVTHSAFHDSRLGRDVTANSLIVKGEDRAADLLRRLTESGATDAKATELSPAEHRAIVLARFPRLVPQ